MTDEELAQLAFNLVDETIEHVFIRFPENPATRAYVYLRIASILQEIAQDSGLV